MDAVKVTLGGRGMTVKATRQKIAMSEEPWCIYR